MEVIIGIILILLVGSLINYAKERKERKRFNEQGGAAPTPAPQPDPIVDARPKLIIDTDMSAEGDPDDVQTWISTKPHVVSKYNLLGVVSTSLKPQSAVDFIRAVLDATGTDNIPIKRGASKSNDVNTLTDGAQFYIDELSANDNVEIHIWGPISSLAQALKAKPSISKSILRVHWVASTNRKVDEKAYEYLRKNHTKSFVLYRDEESFRGMMRSGDKSKLVALNDFIKQSKVGELWQKHTQVIEQRQPEFRGQGWKNGDLTCYLFSINPSLRDSIFKADAGRWFVDQGLTSERRMASDEVRDWMAGRIKTNISLYR